MAVVPSQAVGSVTEEMLAELEELLTRNQLEVIRLRYFEGIRCDRLVGEHLGICRSAVTRRRIRALDRIRQATMLNP